MGPLNFGSLFITLTAILNSIEINASHEHPNISYLIEDNHQVVLTGDSIRGEAIIINGYFLGVEQNGRFYPVDPDNDLSILRIKTSQFVTVTEEFRADLICRYVIRTGRVNPLCDRRRSRRNCCWTGCCTIHGGRPRVVYRRGENTPTHH